MKYKSVVNTFCIEKLCFVLFIQEVVKENLTPLHLYWSEHTPLYENKQKRKENNIVETTYSPNLTLAPT